MDQKTSQKHIYMNIGLKKISCTTRIMVIVVHNGEMVVDRKELAHAVMRGPHAVRKNYRNYIEQLRVLVGELTIIFNIICFRRTSGSNHNIINSSH